MGDDRLRWSSLREGWDGGCVAEGEPISDRCAVKGAEASGRALPCVTDWSSLMIMSLSRDATSEGVLAA